MTRKYDYRLEVAWLLVLILLLALVPGRSSAAAGFSFDDVPDNCGWATGDCVLTCC